ncbi:MAG: hypothetical protein WBX25_25625 [Rhodomicrobium sp.]
MPGSETSAISLRPISGLIIKVQDELDPQVRIGTPEGDFHIAITLLATDTGAARSFTLSRYSWLGSRR